MLFVLHTTAILFITIFLGFCSGFIGIFKQGQDRILINYVFYIALPLNLFLSCYRAKWQIFNTNYLIAYSLAMVFIIILTYILSKKFFSTKNIDAIINTLVTSQVDAAYFTVPLFILIFQTATLAVPLMLLQNTVFLTIGLIFLQMSLEKDKRNTSHFIFVVKRIWHILMHTPIISLSLFGLLLNFIKTPIPHLLLSNAKFIGDTSAAVALFSLGLTCFFHLNELKKTTTIIPLVVLASLKLLIFPVIALIIGIFLKLPHELLMALVLLTASPCATHTYIVASRYEIDAEIATFNVVLTTLFSFVTINIWLYLLK